MKRLKRLNLPDESIAGIDDINVRLVAEGNVSQFYIARTMKHIYKSSTVKV